MFFKTMAVEPHYFLVAKPTAISVWQLFSLLKNDGGEPGFEFSGGIHRYKRWVSPLRAANLAYY